MGHRFLWFEKIPGLGHLPQWVAGSLLITILFGFFAFLYKRICDQEGVNPIPPSRISLRGIFELAVEGLVLLIDTVIGPEGRKYLPILGATFLYILFSNLLGLIPGFLPPTLSLNTNVACAIVIFLYYNYCGFREHGLAYLKHFTGPVLWLAPLMIVIEVSSHLVRILSLSIRLFGNINGDHVVLAIFSHLVPLGIPVIFFGFGLFVSFMQAFIFTLLSMVYIKVSISHDH